MKIDFSQPLRNPYGAILTTGNDGEVLLLGHVAVNALSASFPGDNRSGTEKIACWKLSQKLFDVDGQEYNFKEVDLKAKDVTTISDLVEKIYPSPVIYAQVIEMLEPEPEQS